MFLNSKFTVLGPAETSSWYFESLMVRIYLANRNEIFYFHRNGPGIKFGIRRTVIQ